MTITTDRPTRTPDLLVTLQGGWEEFQRIREGCAQTPNAKLAYFDGKIEILMPGRPHEIFAHVIGLLLSLFLSQSGITFLAVGSADQELKGTAAAQPDQSYCIGSIKPVPDLSIEVVFSSGGISKLARYYAIGVPEVWFWEDGVLSLYHRRSAGYEAISRSELAGLSNLDLEVLKRHILIGETDTGEAVRSFIEYLNQS